MNTTASSEEVASVLQQGIEPEGLKFTHWLFEGLRAGVFLRPRVAGYQPTPLQLTLVVLLVGLIHGLVGRLQINGPAEFNLRGLLAPWWSTAAVLLLAWWALPAAPQAQGSEMKPSGLPAWFTLITLAFVPVSLLAGGVSIAQAYGLMSGASGGGPVFEWAIYLGYLAYSIALFLAFGRWFGLSRGRITSLASGMVVLSLLSSWQFSDRAWWPDESDSEDAARPRMHLSQEAFEAQQQAWKKAVAAIAKERPGVTDVYGLVFAPYASEDVFLRESSMVADVLAERFDAKGRVLKLLNHASTYTTEPWATPLNLERGIEAVARRMDRKNDVLVIYLTSHGASNFKLAAWHWPLEVDTLSPERLRAALDKSGIRNRVIAVSACYSGGWIGPLATDSTLLMTAAHAERTSYGCGRKSPLTYFGRAVFDEQLRQTVSFERAFAAAVPVIEAREKEAGKKDGFSDPQMHVGEKIRPVLRRLERRLAGMDRAP